MMKQLARNTRLLSAALLAAIGCSETTTPGVAAPTHGPATTTETPLLLLPPLPR